MIVMRIVVILAVLAAAAPLAAQPAPQTQAPAQNQAVAKTALSFDSSDGRVDMTALAAPGQDKRPAVIVLHGRQGLEPYRKLYESYCTRLAAYGYRVFLLSYYSRPDEQAMASPDIQVKRERYDQRLPGWIQRVQATVDYLSTLPEVDPARIGVVGFSQGGFVAVGAAGQDKRLAALACIYGGLPGGLQGRIASLPATLVVHGDADTVVPVAEARALDAFATQCGADCTLAIYPRAGHAFALSLDQPDAKDAFKRLTAFMAEHLYAPKPQARP